MDQNQYWLLWSRRCSYFTEGGFVIFHLCCLLLSDSLQQNYGAAWPVCIQAWYDQGCSQCLARCAVQWKSKGTSCTGMQCNSYPYKSARVQFRQYKKMSLGRKSWKINSSTEKGCSIAFLWMSLCRILSTGVKHF